MTCRSSRTRLPATVCTMAKAKPNTDSYIESAPEFARPILTKIRELFHQAAPEIVESIKWGAPCFEHDGLVAGMAAFKKHVRLSFFKGGLVGDPKKIFDQTNCNSMGSIKLCSMEDFPPNKVLLAYIRRAIKVNVDGKKQPRKKKTPRPPAKVPPDLQAALKKNAKARKTFEAFSPSHRREYIDWITEAKREETRKRRLVQAIEWLSEGKPRNWKYMKK